MNASMTARQRVAAEACSCIRCSLCRGNGYTMDGAEQTEYCEECGGSGIVQACARCELLTDMDREGD